MRLIKWFAAVMLMLIGFFEAFSLCGFGENIFIVFLKKSPGSFGVGMGKGDYFLAGDFLPHFGDVCYDQY